MSIFGNLLLQILIYVCIYIGIYIYIYIYIYVYIFFYFIPVQLEKVLYALSAEQHGSFLRRCLLNSSCDSEFHIHGVICMIVRHKENVLGSTTYSDFYVSY